MAITKRQVFYSFHYVPDSWRAAQVRSIGAIEGNKPATDNDWETIIKGSDPAIKKWITEQMKYRSCTIVLIGNQTANRKWINYEIVQSWNEKMGVVGIHIHGLKNQKEEISNKGENPFDYITYGDSGKKLSAFVKCYNPPGANSKERYAWISENLSAIAEEAIKIREQH
jgi:hypothetical protein